MLKDKGSPTWKNGATLSSFFVKLRKAEEIFTFMCQYLWRNGKFVWNFFYTLCEIHIPIKNHITFLPTAGTFGNTDTFVFFLIYNIF